MCPVNQNREETFITGGILNIEKDSINMSTANTLEKVNIIEEEYLPIPGSDATVKICKGLMLLKDAEIDVYGADSVTAIINKDEKIIMCILQENNIFESKIGKFDAEIAKRIIRTSQIQLFQYILLQWNLQGTSDILLDVDDYFKKRGLKRRKENVDRLLEDISILSNIRIDILGNNKGNEVKLISELLTINGVMSSHHDNVCREIKSNKEIKSIAIKMGNWIDNIKKNQFTQFHNQFFRYSKKNDWISIILSVKMGQLLRINYYKGNRNKEMNYKIINLLDYVGISKSKVAKQGHGYYMKVFKNAFETLSKEGYSIKFDKQYNSVDELLKGKLIYENDNLTKLYSSIKYRKASTLN